MKVGVLALQGAFIEHMHMLSSLGVESVKVRYEEDLEGLDGLIIPGGESTAIRKIIDDNKIFDALKNKIESGLPTWGTCAGLILLANRIQNQETSHLKLIDITVVRNGYGRQLGSFKTYKIIPEISSEPLPLVFIRAPYITEVGSNVQVLCVHDDRIVAAKDGNILVTSFHPELSESTQFHKYFTEMINKSKA